VGFLTMEWVLEGTRVFLRAHHQSLTPLRLSAILGAPRASVSVSKLQLSPIVPRLHTVFSESDMTVGLEESYFR